MGGMRGGWGDESRFSVFRFEDEETCLVSGRCDLLRLRRRELLNLTPHAHSALKAEDYSLIFGRAIRSMTITVMAAAIIKRIQRAGS